MVQIKKIISEHFSAFFCHGCEELRDNAVSFFKSIKNIKKCHISSGHSIETLHYVFTYSNETFHMTVCLIWVLHICNVQIDVLSKLIQNFCLSVYMLCIMYTLHIVQLLPRTCWIYSNCIHCSNSQKLIQNISFVETTAYTVSNVV